MISKNLQYPWANINQFWHKASVQMNAIFEWETKAKYMYMHWNDIDDFWNSFSPEPQGQFQPNLAKASLDEGDSSLFKWRATPFSKGR